MVFSRRDREMGDNAREPEKKKRRNRPRKSRKSRRRATLADGLVRAEAIHDLLRALYSDFALPSDGAAAEEEQPASSSPGDGPLPLSFDPEEGPSAFARRLLDALLARSPERGDGSAFAEGRIYCYHCESSHCSHTLPPSHLSVFSGYTPTGYPEWAEFVTLLLARRDPRIDGITENSQNGVAALSEDNSLLKADQLKVFGKESSLYDICGQVTAGYLPLPRSEPRSRMAATFQVVRCLVDGRPRLRLNVIGSLPGGANLVDFLKTASEPALKGLIRSAQKKLGELELKHRLGRSRFNPAVVQPVLTRLARGIERIYRRRRRRTSHAMSRGSERRAVGMALNDFKKAGVDRIFFDEREQTFIVAGPKWRIHVFSPAGRHVTSLTLNREGVQRRIDTRRWRYTTAEEIEKIREQIDAQAEPPP